MYNGAFVACPDPIDFRAYTVINLYKDDNAYALTGEASSVGSGDNYYLTDSVYFAQEKLEALSPAYGGSVTYGDRAEHCWNGDPKLANAYSRLHYDIQYLPVIWERIKATAPKGADLKSWRY